jgi:putative membrane protein
MRFLVHLIVNAAAVFLAANLVPGIAVSSFRVALLAGLILGFVNAIIKPILFVLTLPFTIVTLGLFIFVINAICLALVAWLVPGFRALVAAFFGAIVIGLALADARDRLRQPADGCGGALAASADGGR